MKTIPVNRWTVGIVMALALIFGNDFLAPIMKAVGILTQPYIPAM